MRTDFDAQTLREILDYNPETGVFIWKPKQSDRWNRKYAGKVAGSNWTTRHVTYRVIRIERRPYFAHRLAWLWVTGSWPKSAVDHIDRDGTNNRISNLREASSSQNAYNSRLSVRNKSGFKGAQLMPSGKYGAQIKHNGKTYWLGSYKSAEEAHAAYLKAAQNFASEFARAA